MMTVHEVSKTAGVSIRTLQYYDRIGLLKPAEYSPAGYRLYDNQDLERLQQILLLRELEFPLKEIKTIMESPAFDAKKALDRQIGLLELKKEHIENLISFARDIKKTGGRKMDFSVFDDSKIAEYAKRAKEEWGNTKEYREYENRASGRTKDDEKHVQAEFMNLFAELGTFRNGSPSSAKAQELIRRIHEFISDHYYTCDKHVFLSLGQAYAAGGEFTDNIDKAGGDGTGVFAYEAIKIYCGSGDLR